jgi:uncharacterized protein (TIGR02271 family)
MEYGRIAGIRKDCPRLGANLVNFRVRQNISRRTVSDWRQICSARTSGQTALISGFSNRKQREKEGHPILWWWHRKFKPTRREKSMYPVKNESVGLGRQETEREMVAAYFRNPSDAEKAISQLRASGFSTKDIAAAIWDRSTEKGKSVSIATGWTHRMRSLFVPEERDEYHSHDAREVVDHMGIPEHERRYFSDAFRQGGVLLTVNAAGRNREALSILKNCNAITSENLKAQKPREHPAETKDMGERRIQLLGETLRVNKDNVQRGAVTLKKEVVSERQNIEVPLTHEELVIERRPAEGREATRADLEPGKEIKIPLNEERVRVEKRSIVREEVAVRKRQVQQTKTVGDDVRHEELKVDKEGDVPVESITAQSERSREKKAA